ncbi:unnamed protein product [Durusdinium trenchii]|uniref:AarF domain-containing protein kinase 1 n=2 Tax=Durusdinium trenchii TaxID=1381693 RepID=A0ABP0HLI3_9DINO
MGWKLTRRSRLLPTALRRTASDPAKKRLKEEVGDGETSTVAASSSTGSGRATPQYEEKLAAHQAGQCRPCGYFNVKGDGCRLGDDCQYCHFCTEQDLKSRKRSSKRKARSEKRAAACIARAADINPGAEEDDYEDLWFFAK